MQTVVAINWYELTVRERDQYMLMHVLLSLMYVDNALDALKLSLGDNWPLGTVCLLVKGVKIVVWLTYIKLEYQYSREVKLYLWKL